MIRFAVTLGSLEQLEAFLGLAKALEVSPEMGVALPSPSSARKKSTKLRAKKGKRRSGHMQVKVGRQSLTDKLPPRVQAARDILFEEFGHEPFQKGKASGILMKRMKLANRPTGHISMLLDRGGLVAV